jgi:hypothetical protein
MKTSNKILLSVFLLGFLTIVGIHVALFAKIKSGDFTPPDKLDGMTYGDYAVPATIKAVSITGLTNCTVFAYGAPGLKYNKESNEQLVVTIRNDTMYVTADKNATRSDYEQGRRNSQLVRLTLPENVPIKLQYSQITISGKEDSVNAPSFNIELSEMSSLDIVRREPQNLPACFNKVQIVSRGSNMTLDRYTFINELNVKAANSNLNYNYATIKKMGLDVDDNTLINISKKSLDNLNLTPKQ